MPADLVRFGDGLELDRTAYELRRSGRPLKLERIPMEILSLLIDRKGQLVARDEIIEKIWGKDVFLDTDNSINSAIRKIRQVLKDDPENPLFIQTVTGKGYRFIATVTAAGVPAIPQSAVSNSATEVPAIGSGAVSPALPDQAAATLAPRERIHLVIEEEETRPAHRTPPRRFWLWAGIGLVAVALVALAGWRLAHPPTYVHAAAVIADLDNETGDTEFDHSLNSMLQIDLHQSPYFTVIGEERAREILGTMKQPVDERITAPLAREICERLNGQVYLTPAIAKVGDLYLVSLEANDCVDGHSLGAAHKQASSKDGVLAAFAALTVQVRRDAGESRASLRQFDHPLYNEPTASLEALKAYSEASRIADTGKSVESIPLFQHAIRLDPNFAIAYAVLSTMYSNISDHVHDREAIMKAYALRDTVNEPERLYIEYRYHASVTGDVHAQLDALRQWSGNYPQDDVPLACLVLLEMQTGQFHEAAANADSLLDLMKDVTIPQRGPAYGGALYEIAGYAYYHANMSGKVRVVYAESLQRKVDTPGLHELMLQIAATNGDTAGVAHEIAWSRGKPDEGHLLQYAAMAALASGEVQRADKLFAEASVAAERDKLEVALTDFDDYRARMLIELGLTEKARALLTMLPPSDSNLDKAFARPRSATPRRG